MAAAWSGKRSNFQSRRDPFEHLIVGNRFDFGPAQSAPIQIAMETRKVLMQTSEMTSWNISAMDSLLFLICFHFVLFLFKVSRRALQAPDMRGGEG